MKRKIKKYQKFHRIKIKKKNNKIRIFKKIMILKQMKKKKKKINKFCIKSQFNI